MRRQKLPEKYYDVYAAQLTMDARARYGSTNILKSYTVKQGKPYYLGSDAYYTKGFMCGKTPFCPNRD